MHPNITFYALRLVLAVPYRRDEAQIMGSIRVLPLSIDDV